MATFIGESVVSITELSSASATLSYTVPVGKYSIIKFSHFADISGAGGNLTIGGRTTAIGASEVVYNFKTIPVEILLDAGETIAYAQTAAYYALVLEYNKP